ncbi:MAG: response regulator [Desulfobacteraceae bacterium]
MNQVAETIRDDSAGQARILLIEDESSVAQGLQMILREEGYGVDLARTGQSALDTLSHKDFDLLVADLRLPDMDGMEVIKHVKDESPDTEVIVITGYANVPSAVEAMKTGASGYLPKPFADDVFKAAVEEALKEKKRVPTGNHFKPVQREEKKLIQKREVMRVLKRASDFITKPFDDKPIIVGLDRARENYTTMMEGRATDTSEELAKTIHFRNNLIESSIDGILGCDKDGKIITINRSLQKNLGYSRNEVCEKMSFDQLLEMGGAEKFREKLYSEECGGRNRLFLFETNLVDKTGKKVPVQVSATVMFEEDIEIGIVAFFRDLRELRRLERQMTDQTSLLHQDKMMSLGRLAASVVHEINNPLTGILNYLRLMSKIMNRDALNPEHIRKFQRYLDVAESETDRCSGIVSNLLAFSRKSKMEFGEMSVNELLKRCIMLSQHKLTLQNIQIKTELQPEIPLVWGDFNQIQQCVINLIFNAIDAMPEGGTLSIGSALDSKKRLAEITIRDTGCGIPKEDLPNIFEPFFTTKVEGKGLGLGLSTVYGIVNRHKGTMAVESEVGQGTTFHIKLPIRKPEG